MSVWLNYLEKSKGFLLPLFIASKHEEEIRYVWDYSIILEKLIEIWLGNKRDEIKKCIDCRQRYRKIKTVLPRPVWP